MEKVAEERLNKMGRPVDLSSVNVNSADAVAKVSFERENHTRVCVEMPEASNQNNLLQSLSIS